MRGASTGSISMPSIVARSSIGWTLERRAGRDLHRAVRLADADQVVVARELHRHAVHELRRHLGVEDAPERVAEGLRDRQEVLLGQEARAG